MSYIHYIAILNCIYLHLREIIFHQGGIYLPLLMILFYFGLYSLIHVTYDLLTGANILHIVK